MNHTNLFVFVCGGGVGAASMNPQPPPDWDTKPEDFLQLVGTEAGLRATKP